MSDQLEGDAKIWAQKKKEFEELFKTITDSPLAKIIKHLKKFEDKLKNEELPEGQTRSTLQQALNGTKDGKGKTVMHFAIARGDKKIINHLIQEGCDLSVVDNEGNNAFFTAISHYHLEIVRHLIENHKQDVNQLRNKDQMAIHISCSNGDLKMVEFLIQKGADVNASSSFGKPINWASATQQLPIVKALLENKACPNGDKKQIPPPIILATDFNNLELFDLLLQYNVDVNTTYDDYSVLHVAAEKSHMEILKKLIEKGANTEYEAHGVTPLEHAKKNHQYEVVAYLRQVTKKPISEQVEKEIEEEKKKQQEQKQKEEEASKPLSEEEKKLIEEKKKVNQEQAKEKKELGNVHFAKDETENALKYYQEAIDLDPECAVYYSNKAACLIKQEKFQEAIDTCQVARKVDSLWTKIYFREGQAYSGLHLYGDAAASFWEALKLEPDNKVYKSLFDKTIKIGKQYNKQQQQQAKQ